ncbi:iron-sulfur cluster-binding oxidoreductase [Candidatus Woesearchaeota archaeon]|nr:iron-sulfur cluster-binding oxidoreductase [Candidatus Woesearchaeota archaeon]|tara:strand:+ start:1584 stop:2048 length:465 start_codon:yes stop_codon:yes gene_type:complete
MADIPCGCPGSAMQDFRDKKTKESKTSARQESELKQWPIQLHLVGPGAPYFENADLVITADCVPFAYANFHSDFLKGRPVVIGCPKLDETEDYAEKIGEIIKAGNVKSVTIIHMEVPCCFGLQSIVEEAVEKSGKKISIKQEIITVSGEKQNAQ